MPDRLVARLLLILISVALVASGCGQPVRPTAQRTSAPKPVQTPKPGSTAIIGPSPVETPQGDGEGKDVRTTRTPAANLSPLGPDQKDSQEMALQKAKADLAKRLGLTSEQISVVSMTPVQWSDTSIGCPEEGQSYAEVITPGFKIVLRADGKDYTYHAGGAVVIVCPREAASVEAEKDVELAKKELAKQLDIPETEITAEKVEEVEWRNSALGCAKPGEVYLQVIIPGYLVVLKAQDKTYEYHTGNNRAVTCPSK